MKFSFGADPELFVRNKGALVSAHGMVPGTKKDPHPVKRGAVQVDGMALEFNIEPATNFKDFSRNINQVLRDLKAMIPDDHEFDITPVAKFSRQVMLDAPDEALELGCDPDYNAWKDKVNDTPNLPRLRGTGDFRTASGHLHIGWTEGQDPFSANHKEACIKVVKQLDCSLGLMSIFLDPGEDSRQRRYLYGRAGAYRPKEYGVEYRVLSNFWIKNKKHMHLVYRITRQALRDLMKRDYYWPLMSDYDVQYSINNLDTCEAWHYLEELSGPIRKLADECRREYEAEEIF